MTPRHFGECVSKHVSSRAINEVELAIFDDPSNKMELDVNVLCLGIVLMVFGKCDSGPIV